MKLRKFVYGACLISTTTVSLLYVNRLKYERNIDTHININNNHNANIIAHRGFSSLELENSYNSVKLAFDTKCCDGVEIDVRLSKDEEIVLAHDESLFGIGKIKDKTLDELKEKKYKSNPIKNVTLIKDVFSKDLKLRYDRNKKITKSKEEISTLDEITCNIDENKILLVDLKFNDGNDEKLYEKINDIFEDYDGNLEIIFQGTNYEKLEEMKKLYPNYKYQLIIRKEKELKYLDSDFDYYCIRKNLITRDIVKDLKNRDKNICIWTVNSYSDFKDLSKKLSNNLKDVYIITDYPDEMCYLFNKKINENKTFGLNLKKNKN